MFLVFILTVQFNLGRKVKQKKKTIKDKDVLGIFFSVYVVPVTAGTVSGILALSKSLELCSSSHCSILKKHFSGFLNDGSKVCLI